jgi:peptidoglycan hydrolase-like protein with peptidoglycan-binding domain
LQAPRDFTRRESFARSIAGSMGGMAIAPALAGPGARDLTDLSVWEQSIWRSRARREIRERPLTLGQMSNRKVVIPLAVLATGLIAREAITGGDGSALAPLQATTASHSSPAPAPAAKTAAQSSPAQSAARPADRAPAPAKLAHAVAVNKPPAPTHGTVQTLQRELGVSVDGTFGKQTKKAVRAFQQKHGLDADGVVGAATWKALGVEGAENVLRANIAPRGKKHSSKSSHRHARVHHAGVHSARAHGSGVDDLQRALGIQADGVFGRGTARAVRAFQRKHGLKADGVVGPATWAALGVRHAHGTLKREHAGGHHGRRAHHRHASGGGGSAVSRAIAAANRIATLPYRYGGGHGSFNDSGYDCSGSVSYVLHAAGVLSSPLDSSALMSYGAPGPGRHITIYANSGHTFMTINGRRFDTGYGGHGNRWASGSRPTGGYVVRHPPGL